MYYNNAYYARVGGISNSEVNSLEMEMLRMISFSLFVQPEQYERYRGSLYSHVQPQTAGEQPQASGEQQFIGGDGGSSACGAAAGWPGRPFAGGSAPGDAGARPSLHADISDPDLAPMEEEGG